MTSGLSLAAEEAPASAASSTTTPAPASTGSKRPAVLADGTYATQTAVVESIAKSVAQPAIPNLRSLLLGKLCCLLAELSELEVASCF